MSRLMKLFSIVGLVILIGTINFFLYRLNENFFYSLVLFDTTLCLYFYTLSFLSLTTLPVIALTGLLILFIGWMGYLTYKTWLEENNEDGLTETSKLYWIYLPVFFFSLFLIMFVWTMWIANTEVRKSEFLKRRKQDTNSSTNSRNGEETLKRISLINEFSNQSDKEQ